QTIQAHSNNQSVENIHGLPIPHHRHAQLVDNSNIFNNHLHARQYPRKILAFDLQPCTYTPAVYASNKQHVQQQQQQRNKKFIYDCEYRDWSILRGDQLCQFKARSYCWFICVAARTGLQICQAIETHVQLVYHAGFSKSSNDAMLYHRCSRR
ncbi:hypothetical protein TSAR_013343, partial [Trichomalopsis sarcophagae]